MLKAIFKRIRPFAKDTEGSVSVEFALVMPFLFWAFAAVYTYFDGYRQSTINLKAAYTISDLLSRETDAINHDYLTSMHSLFGLLTRSGSQTALRVSVVRWDEGDDRYYIDWSHVRGSGIALTDASVTDLADQLPVMPDNERVILVETSNIFEPVFNVGLGDIDLENFVFSRPRFAPLLEFDDSDPGPDHPHDDDDTADPADLSTT